MTKPLDNKRAALSLITGQIKQTEIDLSDERANVHAHRQHHDAANARVLDLEGQLATLKDIAEHIQ